MATRKHTTPAVQLDFSFTEAEAWRPVVGYEGLYEVSNLGRVRSLDRAEPFLNHGKYPAQRIRRGRMLRLIPREGFYQAVNLSKEGRTKTMSVHSLVLEAFRGPRPDGYVANHLDCCVTNNALSNLEWTTQQNNIAYKVGLSRQARGERCAHARLKAEEVRRIRSMFQSGTTRRQLAQQFGVSLGTIAKIVQGDTWQHML